MSTWAELEADRAFAAASRARRRASLLARVRVSVARARGAATIRAVVEAA